MPFFAHPVLSSVISFDGAVDSKIILEATAPPAPPSPFYFPFFSPITPAPAACGLTESLARRLMETEKRNATLPVEKRLLRQFRNSRLHSSWGTYKVLQIHPPRATSIVKDPFLTQSSNDGFIYQNFEIDSRLIAYLSRRSHIIAAPSPSRKRVRWVRGGREWKPFKIDRECKKKCK